MIRGIGFVTTALVVAMMGCTSAPDAIVIAGKKGTSLAAWDGSTQPWRPGTPPEAMRDYCEEKGTDSNNDCISCMTKQCEQAYPLVPLVPGGYRIPAELGICWALAEALCDSRWPEPEPVPVLVPEPVPVPAINPVYVVATVAGAYGIYAVWPYVGGPVTGAIGGAARFFGGAPPGAVAGLVAIPFLMVSAGDAAAAWVTAMDVHNYGINNSVFNPASPTGGGACPPGQQPQTSMYGTACVNAPSVPPPPACSTFRTCAQREANIASGNEPACAPLDQLFLSCVDSSGVTVVAENCLCKMRQAP